MSLHDMTHLIKLEENDETVAAAHGEGMAQSIADTMPYDLYIEKR